MSNHSRAAMTINDRLDQTELDMTVVHDAIATLSERLDLIEEAVRSRDESHRDAIQAQVTRADSLLAALRDEAPSEESHEPPEVPMDPASHSTWDIPAV